MTKSSPDRIRRRGERAKFDLHFRLRASDGAEEVLTVLAIDRKTDTVTLGRAATSEETKSP